MNVCVFASRINYSEHQSTWEKIMSKANILWIIISDSFSQLSGFFFHIEIHWYLDRVLFGVDLQHERFPKWNELYWLRCHTYHIQYVTFEYFIHIIACFERVHSTVCCFFFLFTLSLSIFTWSWVRA